MVKKIWPIGSSALNSNKANSRSTSIGYGAMQYADDRVTGRETFNTALGYEALKGSLTPGNNYWSIQYSRRGRIPLLRIHPAIPTPPSAALPCKIIPPDI
jgi:hypothetical protein